MKFIKSNEHTCERDPENNEILKEKCNLREIVVSSSDEPIQQIYEKTKRDFKDMGMNFAIGKYPRYEGVKHFLQDARNKSA